MARNILKLDQAGIPRRWLSVRQAAEYYAHGKILWDLVEDPIVLKGGTNEFGVQSEIVVAPIISVKGKVFGQELRIPLTNMSLFARDEYTCQYCGCVGGKLTRDHILPKGMGGPDVWTNVATSCMRCNSHKGCRTPEQAGFQLLNVPYEPTWYELMFLRNRKKALPAQIEYLSSGFHSLKI